MQILAIDTTGDACSCALMLGQRVTDSTCHVPRAHTRHLLPMVRELLGGAGLKLRDLSAVAFAAGPGSFTGVRIATSIAQGLAMAGSLETVPVSSLAALALAAHENLGATRILACNDARMGEVYLGCFEHEPAQGLTSLAAEEVVAPEHIAIPSGAWTGVGSGFQVHGHILERRLAARLESVHPQLTSGAAHVARLARQCVSRGETVPATAALPRYVRNKVAFTSRERARSESKKSL